MRGLLHNSFFHVQHKIIFFSSQRTASSVVIIPGRIPRDIGNVLKLTGPLNLLVWKGIGKPSEKEMKKKQ
jgi:hypothetical protein